MSLYLERLRDAIRPPSHVECADRALAQTVDDNGVGKDDIALIDKCWC